MLITKELLSKIRKIQIKTDRMVSEILSGEYKSAFKGKGLNFDSIREYQAGDDIRSIDWKVTARMTEPFIRQYKEERQLSIVLMVDLSASNSFGTQDKNKQELTIELAAVLASLAIRNNDKVGMLLFTDHVEAYIPPKQGKSHIFRLIKDLLVFKPKSRKTDLKTVLADAMTMLPKNSVLFLLSDFIDKEHQIDSAKLNYDKELKVLRKIGDLIAFSIRDPREFKLPNIGFVEVINPETGHKELLNLNKKSTRQRFAAVQEEHFNKLKDNFRKLGVDFMDIRTDKPYISQLLSLFLTRERRTLA